MSRRPSVSIYNYPEDLNPFKDDGATATKTTKTTTTTSTNQINPEVKNSVKESKHKFWTFGRSKKKQRSNSFSIKSSWSGLFGKRRDSQEVEIRKPTIATVSSTYNRGTYNGYPTPAPRLSKDQQEFDEALGTLVRRRKYTFDNSSRYSSTLTVNGDPGRIYEGIPQDTTTSIMGDLTPKPPARRFGQVSPKPTDKIPPLDYTGKERTSNGDVIHDDRAPNRTPVPPKRGGPRASQRSLAPPSINDDVSSQSGDVTLTDENENVPEDYVFKRFSHDAIRKSNLSINSCISVGSTMSSYGRKKRRAPQPPRIKEPLEASKENDVRPSPLAESNAEIETAESIDIARVTENIDEMTKRSREMDDGLASTSPTRSKDSEEMKDMNENLHSVSSSRKNSDDVIRTNETTASKLQTNSNEQESIEVASCSATPAIDCTISSKDPARVSREYKDSQINKAAIETEFGIEVRRKSDSKIEITKDVEIYSSREDLPLKRRKSSGNLSRSDSFSVKEEIEKIERQIKLLEAIDAAHDPNDQETTKNNEIQQCGSTRMSLTETRKQFFRNMADNDRVKIELKELPREQNDIRIVRIDDPPIPIGGPTEPVKIIELHISEPIRQKPSIIGESDVNPIPKPRRHSNLELNCKESRVKVKKENDDDDEKRGNSL